MAYEIRARSLAEILDTSFQLLRDRFGLLMGFSFSIYLPLYLVLLAVVVSAGAGALMVGSPAEIPDDVNLPLLVGGGLAAGLTFLAGHCFVMGSLTAVLGHTYLGTPIGFKAACRAGFAQVWRILVATFVLFLVFGLAMIPLGIVGTLLGAGIVLLAGALGDFGIVVSIVGFSALGLAALAVLFFVTAMGIVYVPVVVLESAGPMDAVLRSWTLLTQSIGRSLGVTFTAWLLTALLPGMFQILAVFFPITGTVLALIAQVIAYVFLFAVGVVLYLDLRCRHESFELEHLARVVEGLGPPAGE